MIPTCCVKRKLNFFNNNNKTVCGMSWKTRRKIKT